MFKTAVFLSSSRTTHRIPHSHC